VSTSTGRLFKLLQSILKTALEVTKWGEAKWLLAKVNDLFRSLGGSGIWYDAFLASAMREAAPSILLCNPLPSAPPVASCQLPVAVSVSVANCSEKWQVLVRYFGPQRSWGGLCLGNGEWGMGVPAPATANNPSIPPAGIWIPILTMEWEHREQNKDLQH